MPLIYSTASYGDIKNANTTLKRRAREKRNALKRSKTEMALASSSSANMYSANGFIPSGTVPPNVYQHMNGHLPRPANLYFGRSKTSYEQFQPQYLDRRQYFQTPSPLGRWTPSGTVRSISQSATTTPTTDYGPSYGNHEHAATLSAGSSLSRHFTMTRNQQLSRTEIVINAVQFGIRSCIQSTQKEIRLMRSQMEILSTDSSQGKMFELEKIKSADRYIKRLEFQLCRVEELQEQYETQMRLREGVRNLASAFDKELTSKKRGVKNSPGSSENVKGDMKDVINALSAIDTELEQLMGSINVEMKGIAGFARIAPGDTFEVCLKHGSQRWKVKGKTVSDRTQKWDSEKMTLKALLHDALEIKVSEVKMFGKTSGLADQSCDPIQLFSPDPQLMTMNLNFNGSLKLNLVATWSPIVSPPSPHETCSPWSFSHGRKGAGSPANSRKNQSLSPRTAQRPISVYHNGIYQDTSKSPAQTAQNGSPSNASWDSRSLSSMQSPRSRPVADRPLPESFRKPVTQPKPESGSRNLAAPPLLALLRALKPVLQRLTTPHPELKSLQNLVNQWDAFLKRSLFASLNQDSDASSRSRGSTSVESAMENMRLDTSDSDDLDNNYLLRNSSGNTQDSGFDSFRKRYSAYVQTNGASVEKENGHRPHQMSVFMETPSPKHTPPRRHLGQPFKNGKSSPRAVKRQEDFVKNRRKSVGSALEGSRGMSPLALSEHSVSSMNSSVTTGQTEIDRCLYHHLRHCELLLKSLEMLYGPLHFREQEIFHKLAAESAALDDLLNIAKSYSGALNLNTVLSDLGATKEIRNIWVSSSNISSSKLIVQAEILLGEMQKAFSNIVRSKYPDLVDKVFKKVIFMMTDRETWDPDMITVFQFVNGLRDKDVATYIESLAHETWIISSVETRLLVTVQQIMERLKKVPVPPPPDCLRHIGIVLVDEAVELQSPAESYLLHAQGALRDDLINSFLSFLEFEEPDTRRGACRALAVLNARRCIGPLGFVARSDRKGSVREEARKALLTFGQEGREIMEGSRTGTNGYDMKL